MQICFLVTKFFYFVLALTWTTIILFNSCKKEDNNSVPSLSTIDVTEITLTTAISGGNITYDGGAAVTIRGVCWSTSENPTINDNITVDGKEIGSYISHITGLDQNTTYYVRAYAVNDYGAAYGELLQFTTEEENVEILISGDVYIALGEDFDPLAGVSVTGGSINDVEWTSIPAFNKYEVNEYEFTYSLGNATANRKVCVKSNLLAGIYNVEDIIDNIGTITYSVTVNQSSSTFNILLINGFSDFNIVVYVVINGDNIIIPKQTPAGWYENEYVEGIGTYDGQTQNLESFTYTIAYFDWDELFIESNYALYNRPSKKNINIKRVDRRNKIR